MTHKFGELFAGIALTGIIGWLGWNLFQSNQNRPDYDPITFCQKNAPSKNVTLLIDPSSRFTPVQQAGLRALQASLLSGGLPVNARLKVFTLQEQVTQPPVPVFDSCFPGAIHTGSGSLQRRMVKRFTAGLNTALRSIARSKEDKHSPLLEGLYALTTSDQWQPNGAEVIIYSDLLQHSALLNQYRQGTAVSPAGFLQTHHLRFSGVTVSIFLLSAQPLNTLARAEASIIGQGASNSMKGLFS
jgi:hypothetical protein